MVELKITEWAEAIQKFYAVKSPTTIELADLMVSILSQILKNQFAPTLAMIKKP